jgi:hypothetical protein
MAGGNSVDDLSATFFLKKLGRAFKMLGVRRRGIWAGTEAELPEYPRSGL